MRTAGCCLVVMLTLSILAPTTVSTSNSADGPLFLTPYLQKGDILTARNLSTVHAKSIPFSHSGFLTVDSKLGNHFFFWHFPSQSNPGAPLLIWFNGGPAISSMLGLFWEHGPMEVIADGSEYGRRFGPRKYTWVGLFSVVYVDNPVGTGFSYSDSGTAGYRLTQEDYANDIYHFVIQFCALFPEYTSRGVYIGGQSYAGKYIPASAFQLHENRHGDAANVSLTGILIGGPYFDPPTQSIAFFDYLYAVGAISYADMVNHKRRVGGMHQDFSAGRIFSDKFSELFADLVILRELPLPSFDNYVTGKDADYQAVQNVMTSSEIRNAIHVGSSRYMIFNEPLAERYGPDVLVSTKPKLAVLMDNYKVLIYNGDYDVVVSSVMIEAGLMTTPWCGQAEYNKTHRIPWKEDNWVKGFYSQTGRFCRVVVHGAGHQTPHDAPEASLQMVTGFVKHGCIHQEN